MCYQFILVRNFSLLVILCYSEYLMLENHKLKWNYAFKSEFKIASNL